MESSTPPPQFASSTRVNASETNGSGAAAAQQPQGASSVRSSSLMRRVLQSGRKYMDSTLNALTADIAAQQQTANVPQSQQLNSGSTTEFQQSTERVAQFEREVAALQQYNAQWAQSYAGLEAQCRFLVCNLLNFLMIIYLFTCITYVLYIIPY